MFTRGLKFKFKSKITENANTDVANPNQLEIRPSVVLIALSEILSCISYAEIGIVIFLFCANSFLVSQSTCLLVTSVPWTPWGAWSVGGRGPVRGPPPLRRRSSRLPRRRAAQGRPSWWWWSWTAAHSEAPGVAPWAAAAVRPSTQTLTLHTRSHL